MSVFSHFELGQYTTTELTWLAIGFIGQGLFFARFLVQWLASEKKQKSVMPVAFWYFSIFGGLILFAYAIHRKDIVFTLGQSIGIFVYARNLMLIAKEKKQNA